MLLKAEGHNLPAATPFKPRKSKLQVRYTYPRIQDRLAEPGGRFFRPGFQTAFARTRSEKVGCVKISIRSHFCTLLRSSVKKITTVAGPFTQEEATNNKTRRIGGSLGGATAMMSRFYSYNFSLPVLLYFSALFAFAAPSYIRLGTIDSKLPVRQNYLILFPFTELVWILAAVVLAFCLSSNDQRLMPEGKVRVHWGEAE